MNKRLLLVKPDYNYYPVGLAHVVTCLRNNNIPYDFVDLTLDHSGLWRERLRFGEYFAVASGGLSASFFFFEDFFRECRELSPDTPRIIGGNLTYDLAPDLLFNSVCVDYAVVGEAEVTFPELLRMVLAPGSAQPENIPGIMHRKPDGTVEYTGKRKLVTCKDMDMYPTWDDVDMGYYINNVNRMGYDHMRWLPIFTGRGCIGKCTFCSPTNGAYRMRDPGHVVEEMRRLSETYRIDMFMLMNEIMYPTSKGIRKFLKLYKESGLNIPWATMLRADVELDVLPEMRDAGCLGIHIGYESGSDRVLDLMRKNIKTKTMVDFIRKTKESKMRICPSFIYGNSGETAEEVKATVDTLIKEDVVSSQTAGLLITYPGTQIFKDSVAKGDIPDILQYMRDMNYSNFLPDGSYRNHPYINHSAMSDDELFRTYVEQSRRYKTHCYKKNSAHDLDVETFSGKCAICGEAVSFGREHRTMFGCFTHCKTCYEFSYPNFYAHPMFSGHTDLLRKHLSSKPNVAVYGAGLNASLLHKYDLFGPDTADITCFIRENHQWSMKYLHNTEVVNLDRLDEFKPELVLIADTVCYDHAWNRLVENGVDPERILPFMAPQWYASMEKAWHKRGLDMGRLEAHGSEIGQYRPDVFKPVIAWAARYFREKNASKEPVVALAPAGRFGVQCAQMLEEEGIKVACLLDNMLSQGTKKVGGYNVFSPAAAPVRDFSGVFIATPSFALQLQLLDQMRKLYGWDRESFLLFGDALFGCDREAVEKRTIPGTE